MVSEREVRTMNEIREKLLDRIIRIYGFENEITLDFARFAESLPEGEPYDRVLTCLVESHEEFPQIEDDEDDEIF
jgi:hypothetical protein